ncbi:hypothetical protein BwSH20_71510 [Bradyrhizobium ottawaense]|uniref:Uncharacterized protein n=2 Tax=Bradyrhizobium TaxID=374 RepID=A0A809Z205_9BRAD|nr:hypothetical protein BKD09_40745 [Bradyrhizobium japonicum]BBO07950.1 hypothetical protein SG09_73000 [Bradyrhizobium ottawaense]BBZ92550.1 hypothetical protein F07S3_23830 [Bradyrhizobium diazoefficiens]KMJ94803.1 hypothetical protein CF64_35685 [Bradyrhizobium japonicum]BCA01678.1 hypothetical protein H12S4_25820 [Bradyrhizobium diazoefficiens]
MTIDRHLRRKDLGNVDSGAEPSAVSVDGRSARELVGEASLRAGIVDRTSDIAGAVSGLDVPRAPCNAIAGLCRERLGIVCSMLCKDDGVVVLGFIHRIGALDLLRFVKL